MTHYNSTPIGTLNLSAENRGKRTKNAIFFRSWTVQKTPLYDSLKCVRCLVIFPPEYNFHSKAKRLCEIKIEKEYLFEVCSKPSDCGERQD